MCKKLYFDLISSSFSVFVSVYEVYISLKVYSTFIKYTNKCTLGCIFKTFLLIGNMIKTFLKMTDLSPVELIEIEIIRAGRNFKVLSSPITPSLI